MTEQETAPVDRTIKTLTQLCNRISLSDDNHIEVFDSDIQELNDLRKLLSWLEERGRQTVESSYREISDICQVFYTLTRMVKHPEGLDSFKSILEKVGFSGMLEELTNDLDNRPIVYSNVVKFITYLKETDQLKDISDGLLALSISRKLRDQMDRM